METKRIEEIIMHSMITRGFKVAINAVTVGIMSEADVLGVNNKGYIYEYEIKQSMSDFRADFKKTRKHRDLSERKSISEYGAAQILIPNRFIYACVPGLIPAEDIPEYSGLVYIHINEIEVIKNPPMLHRNTANETFYASIANKMTHRLLFGCAYMTYMNQKQEEI